MFETRRLYQVGEARGGAGSLRAPPAVTLACLRWWRGLWKPGTDKKGLGDSEGGPVVKAEDVGEHKVQGGDMGEHRVQGGDVGEHRINGEHMARPSSQRTCRSSWLQIRSSFK